MAYWYIGTYEQCLDYNHKVNEVEGYTGDITSQWAVPRQHPVDDYYAIRSNYSPLLMEGVEADEDSGLQLVADLGDDWFEWYYE
tara:strand:+ start:462 stop:713 length:252 start_codon:yes stop_codon:yes gene_type:complete